jgi:hypothetical protein
VSQIETVRFEGDQRRNQNEKSHMNSVEGVQTDLEVEHRNCIQIIITDWNRTMSPRDPVGNDHHVIDV